MDSKIKEESKSAENSPISMSESRQDGEENESYFGGINFGEVVDDLLAQVDLK